MNFPKVQIDQISQIENIYRVPKRRITLNTSQKTLKLKKKKPNKI